MLVPFRKALLPGAFLAALLVAPPASGKDVYKPFLDPAIAHHAAIRDTLAKIEESPADAQLHNDLGCLVAWDGFWRDALRSFETASSLDPKDARPWFNAGLVQVLRGEWGAARSRFRKAVKVDPGAWHAWWMLGYAEENLGNDNAAIDAYSRSVRVDTSLFDPRSNPFAVATKLKSRVFLETYERRRVDAALPFANQLASPSRVASFFQTRAKAADPATSKDDAPQSGPVVTTLAPSSSPPAATSPSMATVVDPMGRRRRPSVAVPGRAVEGQPEIAPEARQVPEGAGAPPPGPGFGEGSGAPTASPTPAPGQEAAPPPGAKPVPRRVPLPGPGGAAPDEE